MLVAAPLTDFSFQQVGKLLLPHLERVWEYAKRQTWLYLKTDLLTSLVEASLSACALSGCPNTLKERLRHNIASAVRPSVELPSRLRLAINVQESIVLRYSGEREESDALIRTVLSKTSTSTDIRTHCMYGRLLFSHAENAILRNDFRGAKHLMHSWEAKAGDVVPLELQTIRLKNTVLGRISRYEGDFKNAMLHLESCYNTIPNDHSRYHVMHHLADVYCELDMGREAEVLVCEPMAHLQAQGKASFKAFRRLGLSLAEVYLLSKRFDYARELYTELLAIYHRKTYHDDADQIGHVRSTIGLARVAWSQNKFSESRQILRGALGLTEQYSTFEPEGFYSGVINLFLALVYFELCDVPEAQKIYKVAMDILNQRPRQHHMPGVGSYFLEDLISRVPSIIHSVSRGLEICS